jgi:pimeloyl-ACP methyl ester carboxylesterase
VTTPSLLLAALVLAAPPDAPSVAREFTVRVPAGHELAGVLETASGARQRPTVVLISGAGPHDRDGYTLRTARGHNDAFRQLSARFVRLGHAVVRFDEVGTGRSTGDYHATATTETLARDVSALVATLRTMPEVDPARIILLGHSEGGAIASLVAAADPLIAGVALLAAPAWDGRRIMAYQLRHAAERHRVAVSYTSADIVEAQLVRGSDERALNDPWYRHFLDHDPLEAVRLVRAPALVLQGEDDDVVTAGQAAEVAAALLAGGNRNVRYQVLPGYGHAFTDPLPRGAAAGRPVPLAEEIVALVEDWLLSLGR